MLNLRLMLRSSNNTATVRPARSGPRILYKTCLKRISMVLQIRREEESHINGWIQDFFRGSQGPMAPEFLPVVRLPLRNEVPPTHT